MIVLNDHSFRNKAGRKCIICEDADDRELESKQMLVPLAEMAARRLLDFWLCKHKQNHLFRCLLKNT